MAEKKEEKRPATYPSVEEKIKMKVEKERAGYTEFEDYISKDKILPNGLTVEEPYAPTLEKLTKLLSGNFTFFNESIFR